MRFAFDYYHPPEPPHKECEGCKEDCDYCPFDNDDEPSEDDDEHKEYRDKLVLNSLLKIQENGKRFDRSSI